MAGSNCANCKFKAVYDRNPKSFLGRIWRWHTNWCPGWKAYMRSLDDKTRVQLAEKYKMTKYR